MVQALLFDFDGTLFDTGPGVTQCVRYALEKLGIQEPDERKLRKFVGPPLADMFQELYGLSPETAQEAVRLYRERYQPVGIWECAPYDGMPALLDDLRGAGFRLAVATGKPTPSAAEILRRFELENRVDMICGSEFDGTRSKKSEVVAAVLETFGLRHTPEAARMIGDRKYDVIGAAACGVPCIGVGFGYAEPGELEHAGADVVVDTVAELKQYLLQIN